METEETHGAGAPASFGAALRAHGAAVALLLACALGLRLAFIFLLPHPGSWAGDSRYYVTAANLLAGHGYSWDAAPPYRPSMASVPAYPVFIAAVYALFGERQNAVRVAQAVLDLLTCLLVAYLSFRLAPPRLRKGAAFAALAVYGLLSWFTLIWTTCLLTETLTLFLTSLTLALSARALARDSAPAWAWAGLACGLAILSRPDSVLLLGGGALFLAARAARRRTRQALASAAVFCLAVPLVLAPWTLRNYKVFGVFEPLANEYGCPSECYFPVGYLWWVRTWLRDETNFDYAFNPAWPPNNAPYYFDPEALPRDAYDSEEERRRLTALIERYNRAGFIAPDLDADFRALAYERIRRAPLAFFVRLAPYRAASMLLTGFSTSRPTPYVLLLRIFSVLPIHAGAVLGFVLWRRRPLAALLLAVVAVRVLFFAFHYAPETRYIVEVYPPLIAACGAAAAWAWARLPPPTHGHFGGRDAR
jgi:4-amino-4-deoxy-L-arabinose transferase-like glycosyltransferase